MMKGKTKIEILLFDAVKKFVVLGSLRLCDEFVARRYSIARAVIDFPASHDTYALSRSRILMWVMKVSLIV
jgi:hypothetical protein